MGFKHLAHCVMPFMAIARVAAGAAPSSESFQLVESHNNHWPHRLSTGSIRSLQTSLLTICDTPTDSKYAYVCIFGNDDNTFPTTGQSFLSIACIYETDTFTNDICDCGVTLGNFHDDPSTWVECTCSILTTASEGVAGALPEFSYNCYLSTGPMTPVPASAPAPFPTTGGGGNPTTATTTPTPVSGGGGNANANPTPTTGSGTDVSSAPGGILWIAPGGRGGMRVKWLAVVFAAMMAVPVGTMG